MSSIYESPNANLEVKPQGDFNLYKISGVGIATFFGTMFAGGILMAINFKRLGNDVAAKKALIFSALATFVIFLIIFLIPEAVDVPDAVFTLPQLFAMVQIAKKYQQDDIDTHAANNGGLASNWKAFGIGFLTMAVLLAVIVVLSILFLV